MFVMTSDITIGNYTSVKINAVKWKASVGNFVDTCVIKLPLRTCLKSPVTGTQDVVKKGAQLYVFSEGDKVEIRLGYGNEKTLRFKGFVNRINNTMPLEVECEGYSYQIKRKIFNKSYSATTVKAILTDLTAGTDIKLSDAIPNVPLRNVVFKNAPGLKAMEFFQKECLLTVYFDFDTLYVGLPFGLKKGSENLQLGWNTVEDKELKKLVENTDTVINLVEKNNKGEIKKTKSEQNKYSNVQDLKVRTGLPDSLLKQIADYLQTYKNYAGYQGNVTCFLIPSFEKGMVAHVTDRRFPDRNGDYFVDTIEGSFDKSGGRQKLTLRYYGYVDGQ